MEIEKPLRESVKSATSVQIAGSTASIDTRSDFEAYKIKSQIWNPCGCCCFKPFNLRTNCDFISATQITIGLIILTESLYLAPPNCNEKGSKYLYFFGAGWSALILCAAGVFLLISGYFRNDKLALVSASLAYFFLPFFCLYVYTQHKILNSWPHLTIDPEQYHDEVEQYDDDVYEAKVGFLTLTALLMLMEMYFGICAYQLRAQIKANTDTIPHEPGNCYEKNEVEISALPPGYHSFEDHISMDYDTDTPSPGSTIGEKGKQV